MADEPKSLSCLEIVVVAILLLCASGAYLVWSKGGSPFGEQGKRCTMHLKQIGRGCFEYSEKHDGRFPDRDGVEFLSVIYEHQVQDPSVFLCPYDYDSGPAEGETLRPENTSYCGRKNAAADNRLTERRVWKHGATEPLAADKSPEHHADARIVVFADGHAEELSESEFQAYRDRLAPSD